jgi:acyl-CoA synthetase (AMP-forming)/AMP-acid ligase II
MALGLLDLIKQHADKNPIAPALITASSSVTYDELYDGIVKVSNYFADRNLRPGSRAFLNFANPDLRLIVLFGALDYGLVPCLAQPETLKGNFDYDFAIGSRDPYRPDPPSDIVIDQTVFAGKLADGRRRKFEDRPDDEVAIVFETSGTTGRPKLVSLTGRGHRWIVDSPHRRRFPKGTRFMSTVGAATRYGIVMAQTVLADGGTIVAAPVDALACLKLINLFGVTHLLTTPAFMERALERIEPHNLRCDSLASIRLTGATFSTELVRRIEARFDAEISVGYGTSEVGAIAGGVITSQTYSKGLLGAVNPDLKFVTSGSEDAPGQITLVNNKELFTQYVEKGKVVQYDLPFLQLPDLGYIKDGQLYMAGRADEVYNYSGNIKAYGAIEDEIRKLAEVTDVAIAGAAALGDDRDIVVAVVSNRTLNLGELSERLLARFGWPGAKRHFRFFQTPAIRRSEGGKVDRVQLIRDYMGSMQRTA